MEDKYNAGAFIKKSHQNKMNKPSGYSSYANERADIPFEGSPGILKNKPDQIYRPDEFLP